MLSVDLGEELESFVKLQVSSGRYSDESEALRAAVLLMQGRATDRDWDIAKLGRLIEEGRNSGDAGTADEVFARVAVGLRSAA